MGAFEHCVGQIVGIWKCHQWVYKEADPPFHWGEVERRMLRFWSRDYISGGPNPYNVVVRRLVPFEWELGGSLYWREAGGNML
jgi:hypothetical protein